MKIKNIIKSSLIGLLIGVSSINASEINIIDEVSCLSAQLTKIPMLSLYQAYL